MKVGIPFNLMWWLMEALSGLACLTRPRPCSSVTHPDLPHIPPVTSPCPFCDLSPTPCSPVTHLNLLLPFVLPTIYPALYHVPPVIHSDLPSVPPVTHPYLLLVLPVIPYRPSLSTLVHHKLCGCVLSRATPCPSYDPFGPSPMSPLWLVWVSLL